MSISSLYKDYYQKSRLFLYPALKIKRGESVTPIETYMSWEGLYTFDDCKLICIYYLRDDEEFKKFERTKLLGNELFETFIQLENNRGAYVFDFTQHQKIFTNTVHGKYSKIDQDHKVRVMTFFSGNRSQTAYIESYLYPDKYFGLYAKLLSGSDKDMDQVEKLLTEVGELCSIPNLEEETFKETPVTLNIAQDYLHLSSNQ
jgi:hypothetical protein